MLLLRRKGPKAPFAPVTLILLFGKKKPAQVADNGTVADSETEAFPVPDTLRKTISGNDVSNARDRLRLASLERDIIGDALTKIYEAEAKGQINEPEKNQLLQRYKTDLKRVDGEIDTHKKTVDLYDLESAKEDLLKSFHEKMLEIDLKIRQPSHHPRQRQTQHRQHPRLPPRKGLPERSPRTRQKNGSKPSGKKSSKPWND